MARTKKREKEAEMIRKTKHRRTAPSTIGPVTTLGAGVVEEALGTRSRGGQGQFFTTDRLVAMMDEVAAKAVAAAAAAAADSPGEEKRKTRSLGNEQTARARSFLSRYTVRSLLCSSSLPPFFFFLSLPYFWLPRLYSTIQMMTSNVCWSSKLRTSDGWRRTSPGWPEPFTR